MADGATRRLSVSVTVTIPSGHLSVHKLKVAVLKATRAAGRQLNLKAFVAAQQAWLAQHPNRFSAQRWRTLHWLTPFDPIRLPVRVVRDKTSGRYLTLSKVFLRPKATRLLYPRPRTRSLRRRHPTKLSPCRQADAQAALEALAQSPLRHLRPKEFQTLWGYLQNHRHGIDAWHQIPAALRRGRGRTPPPSKAAQGPSRRTSRCTSTAASNARAAVGIRCGPNDS